MNMQRIRALQNVISQQGYGSPNSVPAISQARRQGQVMGGQLGAGFGKMPAIQALRQRLFAKNQPVAPTRPGPNMGGQGIPAQVTGGPMIQQLPDPQAEAVQSPGVAALRRNLGPAAGEGQGGGGGSFFRHSNAGNWAQPHQSTPFENWRKGTVRA